MPTSRTSYQESRHEAPTMAQVQTDQEKGFEQPKPLPDDDLPSNICDESQLALVPKECLSGNEKRPLLHVDELGIKYHYALQPMMYSVIFILVVELLERFSFYGIYYTQTLFLIGAYNADWNAGFSSVKASSFVSISTMVAYTTPFVGAFLADSVWGDYKSILFGLLFFYLPGVLLVALTTVPYLLGDEFNESLLTLGVLFLWPMGTGIVKSIVNVFGAKQFHPLLQSSLIESYYVNFYMAINIGALAGIAIVPIVAQQNLTVAYFWPLMLLVVGVIIFVAGTPRYVCSPPRGELFAKKKRVNKDETISLMTIFRVCILIVPFCVGYNQMPTTFIVQGTVMTKAFGFIDVASMNSLDATSVLFFGYLTASHIYPALAKRDIKIPTTYKFAMGSFLGALAILWAIFVEHKIHAAYQTNRSQICVLWQAPSYILIGWGEIFAVSAAYEVAFTASSPDKKVLASATNIFCVGGLPNLLCIFLYHGCSRWFMNSKGTTNIQYIEDYATAKVGNYFFVLFGIMVFGVIVNTLPWVRDFVSSVEYRAAEIVKTPVLRKPQPGTRGHADEASPLLTPGSRRYQQYLRDGSGPVLYKMGSMRAGPSLSQRNLPGAKVKKIKYKYLPKLYRSEPTLPKVARDPDGNLLTAGEMLVPPKRPARNLGHLDSA